MWHRKKKDGDIEWWAREGKRNRKGEGGTMTAGGK